MEKKEPYKKLIIMLSIAIPLAVASLFRVRIDGYDLSFLPPIYAGINGITAVLLVIARSLIKSGNQVWHERLMKTCILLSAAFLVMYVLYHMTTDSTTFGGDGLIQYFYYVILVAHVLLSIAVVPLVLFTLSRALSGNFSGHKRLARITFPIWLFVAVSGVVVYLMISPYYP
jgi:putative membrane protein